MYLLKSYLTKSQLSLFGHDHHIAYTRTNKNGTVSQIRQKGSQPVHEQVALDFTAPKEEPKPEVKPIAESKPKPEHVPKSVDHKELIANGKALLDSLSEGRHGDEFGIRLTILEHFKSKHDLKDCQKRANRIGKNSSGNSINASQLEDVAEALQVIGPKAVPTLKYARHAIEKDTRAFAGHDSIVLNPTTGQITIWHEVAHHIEKSHKEIGRAAKRFVMARAEKKNGKPVIEKLSALTKNTKYADTEVAVKDSFLHDYTGKVYSDKYSTEVLSMGFQYLATTTEFKKVIKQDPEHLHFVLGVLHHLNGKA